MSDSLKMFSEPRVIVPKQRLSPWIRWPLRLFAYPFMMMELLAQSFVHFFIRPKYSIVGACKKRGACCQYIHMGWPKKGRVGLLSKAYLFWQTEVLGFYFKEFDFQEEGEITKVMGCRYLSKEGQCTQYFLRPKICRNWPKVRHFRKPTLLKGCGYKAVLRKSQKS